MQSEDNTLIDVGVYIVGASEPDPNNMYFAVSECSGRGSEDVAMTDQSEKTNLDDPYDLNRFLQAQQLTYDKALAEVKNGHKRSHWM